jgi:thiamine kinase-like enzyme
MFSPIVRACSRCLETVRAHTVLKQYNAVLKSYTVQLLPLSEEVLHQHPFADDWQALQQQIETWIAQFRDGSDALLRFVGLLPT